MFMLYEPNLKNTMLDVLEDKVSSIANCIVDLNDSGYTPNKRKLDILNWSMIMIDAFENIDVFSKEQQQKLDILYNKVLKL